MVFLSAFGVWVSADASKEENRPETAFSTHSGQFQWRVMPFGLTSGPASFTRLMNLALSELTSTHCLAYLDDTLSGLLPSRNICIAYGFYLTRYELLLLS